MPSQVAGNLVLDQWTVLDGNSDPLTGMLVPADVTLTLLRQSGSTMIAASETVAWTEIGVTGRYYLSFTPQNTGLYVLILREIDGNTQQRVYEFRYDVLAAGATFAPSYANAFCAETDVERYLNQQIDSTTSPNDTAAAGWAEGRADALESLCAALGNPVTPATITAGRLQGLLREANSIGAAMDYRMAQAFKTGAAKTEHVEALLEMWESYVGKYVNGKMQPGTIAMEITSNLASLATSHVLSGDTTARADEAAPQDVGLQIRMTDLY